MRLSEILSQLSAKFPAEDHKERDLPGKQSTWWYIPWQRIRSRLDEVCPDNWEVSYSEPHYLDKFCYVTCTLKICGISRQGIGSAQIELISSFGKDMSRGNPIERAVADAFKTAAEQFQICAYLDEQSDEATKADFIRYMHKNGNSKPAVQWQNEQRGSQPRKSDPPAKPFGQSRHLASSAGAAPTRSTTDRPPVTFTESEKISPEQLKRFWSIARSTGYTDEGVKQLIAVLGFTSTRDITVTAYEGFCEKAGDPEYKDMYNEKGEKALMDLALANGHGWGMGDKKPAVSQVS